MFSTRFQRPVILTSHAKIRMEERNISEIMLLEAHVVVKTVMHHFTVL